MLQQLRHEVEKPSKRVLKWDRGMNRRQNLCWDVGDDKVNLPFYKLFDGFDIIDRPRAHGQAVTMSIGNDSLSQKWVVDT